MKRSGEKVESNMERSEAWILKAFGKQTLEKDINDDKEPAMQSGVWSTSPEEETARQRTGNRKIREHQGSLGS